MMVSQYKPSYLAQVCVLSTVQHFQETTGYHELHLVPYVHYEHCVASSGASHSMSGARELRYLFLFVFVWAP